MITANNITDEQIRELFDSLISNLPVSGRLTQSIHDVKFAANALGIGALVEGVDCRMPHGMEAEFARRGRARCAEILNQRARAVACECECAGGEFGGHDLDCRRRLAVSKAGAK